MKVTLRSKVETVCNLVGWVKQELDRERHDMFAVGDRVRAGVLVLVNDVHWELEGKGE